MTIDVTADLRS